MFTAVIASISVLVPPATSTEGAVAEPASTVSAADNDVFILGEDDVLEVAAEDNQPILTGFVELTTKVVFPDLFVQTKGPGLRTFVSYGKQGEGCAFDAYALMDLDPSGFGDEVAGGVSCRLDVGKTRFEGWVNRSEYRTTDGLTDFTLRAERGRVDAMVSYFQWDRNPDGFSAQVGYTLPVGEHSVRAATVYTSGFGDTAVVAVSLEGRLQVGKNFSLSATGIRSVWRENTADGRRPQFFLGARWTF